MVLLSVGLSPKHWAMGEEAIVSVIVGRLSGCDGCR